MTNPALDYAIEHAKEVKRYIFNRTDNSDDTEDIYQELVTKFLTTPPTTNPECMNNVVFGSAHNRIYDFYRKQRNTVSIDESEDNSLDAMVESEPMTFDQLHNSAIEMSKSPLVAAIEAEDPQYIIETIHNNVSNPIHRQCLEYLLVDELSKDAVGSLLGMRDSTIRMVMSRFKKSLGYQKRPLLALGG
jgi:RNA polymerase sigma factor (sigma-70 family)